MTDRAKATALQLAKADLERLGYRYSAEDIGKRAAVILNALENDLKAKEPLARNN